MQYSDEYIKHLEERVKDLSDKESKIRELEKEISSLKDENFRFIRAGEYLNRRFIVTERLLLTLAGMGIAVYLPDFADETMIRFVLSFFGGLLFAGVLKLLLLSFLEFHKLETDETAFNSTVIFVPLIYLWVWYTRFGLPF